MDSTIFIHKVGSVYYPAQEGVSQPDLTEHLLEVCSKRYRRIDRFTQLTLLGATNCVGSLQLPVQTALYLASSTGPAGNNINLQKQVIGEGEAPSPIQFINSVTNSASFYVMKEHGLNGQNLFVARHRLSFQAALELALVDLISARIDTALVGVVEEITHPLSHQKRRLNLAETTLMGEGSHWFLLSRDKHLSFLECGNSEAALGAIDEIKLFGGEEEMINWLDNEQKNSHVSFSSVSEKRFVNRCLSTLSNSKAYVDDTENPWDGKTAGIIGRFLTRDSIDGETIPVNGELLVISSDSDGRYQIVKIRKL